MSNHYKTISIFLVKVCKKLNWINELTQTKFDKFWGLQFSFIDLVFNHLNRFSSSFLEQALGVVFRGSNFQLVGPDLISLSSHAKDFKNSIYSFSA